MKKKIDFKKIFFHFLLIQAGISVVSGIGGVIYTHNGVIPSMNFITPFLLALLCTIPELLLNTEKIMSKRRIILEQITHLLLIEVLVLSANYFLSSVHSLRMQIWIAISVVIIYLFVNVVSWLYGNKEADEMTAKLMEFRKKNQ